MKITVSKILTAINGAPVALSATSHKVKSLTLRSELGLTAIESNPAMVYATAAKIGSGGVFSINAADHGEIDLAETFVQTSGVAVKLHVTALD